MAVTREEIIEALKEMSLLEASELVKDIEETFGVSAAAPVAVAAAAPATPKCSTGTNSRSSPMFSRAEMPRNHKGTTEFPTARSKQAKKL